MKVYRTTTILCLAVSTIAACDRHSGQETIATTTALQDSLSYTRERLADQAMQAAMFVNEVNKELAKARSLAASKKQLQTPSEIAEVNVERNQVLARITQLVEQLDGARGRLAGLRKQVAEQDSTLTARIAEYEALVAETNRAAEAQRLLLQTDIQEQATRIASLSKDVDTLTQTVGRLSAEHNAAYVVVGTKAELIKKGVLVPEGPKRFLIVGSRPLEPARNLDPRVFTKIDSRTDSTIVLPHGVYRIVSRQDGAFASPQVVKGGKIVGAFKIEQPERFWSTSRFLIIIRT